MTRPYCSRCDQYFNNWGALRKHERNTPFHWLCDWCAIDFGNESALVDHLMTSPKHFYCWICDEEFGSEQALENHFDTDAEDPDHWYCWDCKRFFDLEQDFDTHMRSAAHRPRNVHCPFDECHCAFVSRSALLLHLEGGSCPSGINQEKIDQIVLSCDKKYIVVDEDGYYGCLECDRPYDTLSALCQHIESKSCAAGKRRDIQRTLKGIMRKL